MPELARLNDTSDHGGTIISASAAYKLGGTPGVVEGDLHRCPIRGHGVTPLISGSIVKSNGKLVIRIGDRAGCGAAINSGAGNTTSD